MGFKFGIWLLRGHENSIMRGDAAEGPLTFTRPLPIQVREFSTLFNVFIIRFSINLFLGSSNFLKLAQLDSLPASDEEFSCIFTVTGLFDF